MEIEVDYEANPSNYEPIYKVSPPRHAMTDVSITFGSSETGSFLSLSKLEETHPKK